MDKKASGKPEQCNVDQYLLCGKFPEKSQRNGSAERLYRLLFQAKERGSTEELVQNLKTKPKQPVKFTASVLSNRQRQARITHIPFLSHCDKYLLGAFPGISCRLWVLSPAGLRLGCCSWEMPAEQLLGALHRLKREQRLAGTVWSRFAWKSYQFFFFSPNFILHKQGNLRFSDKNSHVFLMLRRTWFQSLFTKLKVFLWSVST